MSGALHGPATRIVVGGVSGSGKSTVGWALAAALGLRFVDGDDLHPESNVARMRAGVALTDDDRTPWLAAVGSWLAAADGGGVVACSALTRAHRDLVRLRCVDAWFAQLTGSPSLIESRQAVRPGHFMPTSLMASQLALLEPLQPDEAGLALDVAEPVDVLVTRVVAALAQD